MASRRGGKRVPPEENTSPMPSKRGRKPKKSATEEEEPLKVTAKSPGTPHKKKTLGVRCNNVPVCKPTSPRHQRDKEQCVSRAATTSKATGNTKTTRSKRKGVTPSSSGKPQLSPDGSDKEEQSQSDKEKNRPTASQAVRVLKSKILNIYTKVDEQFGKDWLKIKNSQTNELDNDLSEDSDDQVEEEEIEEKMNKSQSTMENNVNYTKHSFLDKDSEEEDLEQTGNDASESSHNVSKLKMVPDEVDYDDPCKEMDAWWEEDPSRELILCSMWEQARHLYDMNEPGYRLSGTRDVTLRKFAEVLHVPPHVIHTRMTSLRSMFQKLTKTAPSGSGQIGKTSRQKEVGRLLHFLKGYVKTNDTFTSYRGRSPAKPQFSYQMKSKLGKKKTPKKTARSLVPDSQEDNDNQEDASISLSSMSPIAKAKRPTTPDQGSTAGQEIMLEDGEEDFYDHSSVIINTKHFSRNERLHDKKTMEVSARKALRLTPPGKKDNPSKVKSGHGRKPVDSGSGVSSFKYTVQPPKEAPMKSTPKKRAAGTVTIEDSPTETAMDRYKRLKCGTAKEISDMEHSITVTYSKDNLQKKGQTVATAKPKHRDSAKASTSKIDSTNTSTTSTDMKRYGVEINPEWFEQQGSEYRKLKEAELTRKRKEKAENDPMVSVMKEKADSIKLMAQNFAKDVPSVASCSALDTPEQLWANSLVPHLIRMQQEKRDQFMVHVLGLAFKAISGKWPEEK